MINQSLEEATEQSTTVTSPQSAGSRSSTVLRNGYLKIGYQLWQRRRSEEKISILRESIQGHSGDNAVDPALQNNELLPEGFTEYIYHVGNSSELNSIMRNGLIPGGKSLKRGRQAVFFTTVNPMEDADGVGETPRDLTKPRIAPYRILGNAFKQLYVGAI